MRKNKTPYTRAKNRAWKAFSDYIRARDCLKTTGTLTECYCVTCGKRVEYKKIQAGHAIGTRRMSILFDKELVNGQCDVCNGYGGGMYPEYHLWFIETYGKKMLEEKVRLKNQSVKLKISDLDEITQKYKDKLLELKNGKQ